MRLPNAGCRVLGIEQFAPGHDRGSSHGETRIIRLGYFEHPSYVPLLRRTYALWREIEAASQTKLLHITGIAEIGPPDGEVMRGTLAASWLHGLPHETMDAAETMRRFPAFNIPADYVGVFQPDGGFLSVEAGACGECSRGRSSFGAEIRNSTAVMSVGSHAGGVFRVRDQGQGDIDADKGSVIIAAGPWLTRL